MFSTPAFQGMPPPQQGAMAANKSGFAMAVYQVPKPPILIPVREYTDFTQLNAMVQEVNATQVAPEEVLSNHTYRFNRNEKSITYYYDDKGSKYTFQTKQN